jgi:hypothetical protein
MKREQRCEGAAMWTRGAVMNKRGSAVEGEQWCETRGQRWTREQQWEGSDVKVRRGNSSKREQRWRGSDMKQEGAAMNKRTTMKGNKCEGERVIMKRTTMWRGTAIMGSRRDSVLGKGNSDVKQEGSNHEIRTAWWETVMKQEPWNKKNCWWKGSDMARRNLDGRGTVMKQENEVTNETRRGNNHEEQQ